MCLFGVKLLFRGIEYILSIIPIALLVEGDFNRLYDYTLIKVGLSFVQTPEELS